MNIYRNSSSPVYRLVHTLPHEPAPHSPAAPAHMVSVWYKQVGNLRDFIGQIKKVLLPLKSLLVWLS